MQNSVNELKNLELDSEIDGEPVKRNKNQMAPFGGPGQKFGSNILDHLLWQVMTKLWQLKGKHE